MKIGDIELAIVNSIDTSNDAEVDEIKSQLDSIPVKHESSVQSLTILGFMNEELHSQNLSLYEQQNNIRKLRNKEKIDNSIDYDNYKGHLLIEEVNFVEEGESRIVKEFEIEARYFPWPKYYAENEP